jgi:hypothetical protein
LALIVARSWYGWGSRLRVSLRFNATPRLDAVAAAAARRFRLWNAKLEKLGRQETGAEQKRENNAEASP